MEENMELQFISTAIDPSLELIFIPKAKQKVAKITFDFNKMLIKGVTAKGNRMATREVKKVTPVISK
jgi:topoisomerase-4 subunit A